MGITRIIDLKNTFLAQYCMSVVNNLTDDETFNLSDTSNLIFVIYGKFLHREDYHNLLKTLVFTAVVHNTTLGLGNFITNTAKLGLAIMI